MAHRDMAWVVKGKLAQLLGNAGLSRVGRFRSLVRDRMRPPRHAELVAHRLQTGFLEPKAARKGIRKAQIGKRFRTQGER